MIKVLRHVRAYKYRIVAVAGLVVTLTLTISGQIVIGKPLLTLSSVSIADSQNFNPLNRLSHIAREPAGEGTLSLCYQKSLKPAWEYADGAKKDYNAPDFVIARAPARGTKTPEVLKRKATFIRFTLPLIQRANELILRDRDRVLDLSRRTERGWALSPADTAWLAFITERYGMKKQNIRGLLTRVDIIPPSLAIAQAAEESGWGTSRFATEGNALFGQRIYRQGNKGMIPHKRPKGKSFKVRAFAQLIDGVKAYVHNLNSHFAYEKFREQRAELRAKKREIDGYLLAGTLTRYSERGHAYVDSIRSIMRENALGLFDSGKLWRPELMDLRGPGA